MNEIWIAFITGLTAGGLSCMAVQGGLLAGSLAGQAEKDLRDRSGLAPSRPARKGQAAVRSQKTQFHLAAPITFFLMAKLVAYTLLGFLLGLLGSSLSLTPMMRAILQFAIGIFMIGNALRMFNVHPIFRYFNFEPPAFIRRYVRKSSKNGTSLVSPLFLGAMTVLRPCGIAQSMMAVALGTATPWTGAAILFSFTLGTGPVFFALSYTAAKLGAAMEKNFLRIVAVVLLILGFYAIDTGLNVAGSPYSITSAVQAMTAPASTSEPVPASAPAAQPNTASNEVVLYAKNNGYTPRNLQAMAEQPVKLRVVTQNTTSCALAFTIPELNLAQDLPTTGSITLDIPPQPKGKVMRFSCSMGMYTGQIVFQ